MFLSWPPFCVSKFMTCCWLVRCKAFTNLWHWSCDTNRSNMALFLLYTVLSLQTSANWGRVSTPRLRSWSSNPKSGSMMFARSDFSLMMLDKIGCAVSRNIHTENDSQTNHDTMWYNEYFHTRKIYLISCELLTCEKYNEPRLYMGQKKNLNMVVCLTILDFKIYVNS